MTDLQREEALNQAEMEAYREKADWARKSAEVMAKLNADGKQAAIDELNATAAFNDKLADTYTLMERVGMAAKQALEDGLVDYLTEGVMQAQNLGKAMLGMAQTVVTEIQRVYAQDLAKEIMVGLTEWQQVINTEK